MSTYGHSLGAWARTGRLLAFALLALLLLAALLLLHPLTAVHAAPSF